MALVRTDGRHLCNRQKTMSNQLVFIGLGDRTPLNWLVPPIHPLDGRLKAAPKTRRKSIDGRVLCRQSFVSGALSVPCRVSVVMATIFLHILCAALLQSSRAGYTAVGRTFISRKERRRIPTNCTSTTRRNEKERQKRRSTTLNDVLFGRRFSPLAEYWNKRLGHPKSIRLALAV